MRGWTRTMAKFYPQKELAKIQSLELMILKDFIDICEKHGLCWFGIAGTILGALRHQGFIPWDDDIDVAMPRADFEKFRILAEEELGGKYILLNTENYPHYPLHTSRLCLRGTVFIEEAMKGIDCPFGIFLDLYPYDNLADDETAYRRQIKKAWLYSKLQILSEIREPVLFQKGLKRTLVKTACAAGHGILRLSGADTEKLYWKGETISRALQKTKTKRIGFPFDTDPEWNTLELEDIFPLAELPFEDMRIKVPGNYRKMLENLYGETYMTPPPEEDRKTHYPYRLDFGPYQ